MEFKREWVIPTGVGIGSFIVGGIVSHIFTRYKFKFEVEEVESENAQLQFQFEENTATYNSQLQQTMRVIKELKELGQEVLTPVVRKVKQEQDDVMARHPSNGLIAITENEDIPPVNIFNTEDDDWDYTLEVANRSSDKPYIIHRDEFFEEADSEGYSQTTLMYYEGDHILCDDEDVPVYEPEKVVGILKFGHGSRDQSICYVRNDKLKAEYEVIVDHGYFQVEVLGSEQQDVLSSKDLKHSLYKLRRDD